MKKFIIRIPTTEEEFNNIINSIRWAKYFKEKNFSVIWPKLKIFEELINSPEKLKDTNFEKLKNKFEKEEYHQNTQLYKSAIEKIENSITEENILFNKLEKLNKNWQFKIFKTYTIKPTAYGPGGSYDHLNQTITILFNPEGKTKKNLTDTIIHETIHIGIQDLIVNKYKLTHSEKERIVDLICKEYFQDILPNYKEQKIGDKRIDDFVQLKTIKNNLPKAIKEYTKQYPRN